MIASMNNISTIYSEKKPLNEMSMHPNPYFERKDFLLLDGIWEFELNEDRSLPFNYSQKIEVPYSVETPLSGVMKEVTATDYMHYRKNISIPKGKETMLARLVFLAIDQEAWIYVDGEKVGESHFGYFPSEVVFPVAGRKEIRVEVVAHDDTSSPVFARGKQSKKPHGVWYHPTSGIWGSVYLEFLPASYLSKIKLEASYDRKALHIKALAVGTKETATASVYLRGEKVREITLGDDLEANLSFEGCFEPWDADNPSLYQVSLSYGDDEVHSIFAFRKIEKRKINGKSLIFVNEKPTFLSALLDQGYYPESGLTPPSFEAMENDIETAKKAGYNCLRKHIKIEPPRWYYLCDLLGMYVIQDLVSGGASYSWPWITVIPFLWPSYPICDKAPMRLGRRLRKSREQFLAELKKTYEHLSMVPSIIMWTIFNEGWGQFQTKVMLNELRALDKERLIDATSGWYDKKAGDFLSKHIYFQDLKMKNDGERILSLSEFGGYSLDVKGHTYDQKHFGYKWFDSEEALNTAIKQRYEKVLRLIENEGLSVAVYTQLSDVEGELNGLLTYDRKVVKADLSMLSDLNDTLYEAYEKLALGE